MSPSYVVTLSLVVEAVLEMASRSRSQALRLDLSPRSSDTSLFTYDPGSRLLQLSTFLGHVNPQSTAVYLTITTELLTEASRRFERWAAPLIHEVAPDAALPDSQGLTTRQHISAQK